MTLPADYLARPFAHRGLHDAATGVIENSRSAFAAAIAAGYGIELDVQISRDGVPVVFHDDRLDRLTDLEGPVSGLTAEQLGTVRLSGSDDVILPLSYVLDHVGGRVPVLVEIKDQGGAPGAEQAVGQVVADAARGGARLAVMSFNPLYIHALDWLPVGVHLGLTTQPRQAWPQRLPAGTRDWLAEIGGWRDSMSFVSHDRTDLASDAIARLRDRGASVLCWTVRSEAEAREALLDADQITFEAFRPA